ncbi:alpha/beta fold hydrolase [Streptomyces sp. NPDC003631]
MHDTALGTDRAVALPSGRSAYTERGSGSPVVFVHGLLVNANLWREVLPAIAEAGFRRIAPDRPLGAHEVPMPADADLMPSGVAALIAEFLETLDLTDVTGTGGALTQILMANRPERLGRVALAPCDAFEAFLPKPFSSLWSRPPPSRAVTSQRDSVGVRTPPGTRPPPSRWRGVARGEAADRG